MITVARFQLPEEAHLFRSYLESAEIEAYVFDEHVVQLFWHYSNAIGGVRVVVADEDEERAFAAYREYMDALQQEPREVSVVRGWPMVVLLFFVMGIPALIFGRRQIVANDRPK
jgi:hypothetical protein